MPSSEKIFWTRLLHAVLIRNMSVLLHVGGLTHRLPHLPLLSKEELNLFWNIKLCSDQAKANAKIFFDVCRLFFDHFSVFFDPFLFHVHFHWSE